MYLGRRKLFRRTVRRENIAYAENLFMTEQIVTHKMNQIGNKYGFVYTAVFFVLCYSNISLINNWV